MNKSTKIQALVISLFVALGVAAPLSAVIANQPKTDIAFEDHTTYERKAPEAQEEPEAELVMEQVTLHASARKTPPRVKETTFRCYRHELEQGGSPTAKFVTVCL